MRLSEIKQLLAAGDIRLTKSLGQNFLHDANQLRRIVEAAELAPGDKVLEIGPGLGPLTERLIERAGEVLAIEKDARLVEVLRQRFQLRSASIGREADNAGEAPALAAGAPALPAPSAPGLRLLHDDALAFLRRAPRDWSQWKLVANLPYSVASPMLIELAQANPAGPVRMVATLQIEVARRLMAKAGEKDYGVLTLLAQLDYEPRGWFKIPAGCFFPEPEVDSACVSLARRPQPLLAPEQKAVFVQIVKRSFSQRRKMIGKLLKTDWPGERLERAMAGLVDDRGQAARLAQARAESLTLEQFVRLTQALTADSAHE